MQMVFIVVGAFLSVAFYWASFQARRGWAIVTGTEPPKEMFGFFALVMALAGAFLGWMAYPVWQAVQDCMAYGVSVAACIASPAD